MTSLQYLPFKIWQRLVFYPCVHFFPQVFIMKFYAFVQLGKFLFEWLYVVTVVNVATAKMASREVLPTSHLLGHKVPCTIGPSHHLLLSWRSTQLSLLCGMHSWKESIHRRPRQVRQERKINSSCLGCHQCASGKGVIVRETCWNGYNDGMSVCFWPWIISVLNLSNIGWKFNSYTKKAW